jgi:cation transport ATPase
MFRLLPILKRLVVVYTVTFILFTAIFLLMFHVPVLQFQKIFFYKGLMFLAITTLICFIGIIFYAKKTSASIESLIAAMMISMAINLSIFIVFPVTVERSVTIFLLSTLEDANSNKSCKGLTHKQMEKALIDTFIVKNDAVSKRIKEQSVIKTVEKNGRCLRLTNKGMQFLNFSRVLSSLYNIHLP